MGGKKEKCGTARPGGGVLDKSIIDRMMLRYRPIAPKPVVNGSSTGEETSESNKKNIFMKPKRKYVRVRRNYKPRKRKITPSPAGDEGSDIIRRNCQQQQQKEFRDAPTVTGEILRRRRGFAGVG